MIDNGGTDHGGVDMDQTPNTISFTVTPVDDPATLTVSGTPDLAVLESAGPQGPAGDPQASGSFTISDPDGTNWNELKPGTGGTYGTFTINANGTWTYTLDDNNASVQALNDGQTLTDSIVVLSKDLSVSQTVSVTITGQYEVINGTSGDDTALNGTQWGDKITAGLGDDQVSAGSGDDLIYDYVGDGSDTYNGGSNSVGGGDTLIFSGNRADYTVTKVGPLFFFEHTDGTIDQATNIEFFKFADTGVLNQTAVLGSLAPTITNGGVADLGDLIEDNPNTFIIGNLNSYVTGTGPFTFGPTGTIATDFGQYQVLSNGQVLYQLDNTKAATNALAQGQIGIDSLNFTVTGPGGTANGSMKVDITGHNDAPIAVNDVFTTPLVEGAAGTFDVLANDSDPDSAFHIVGINAITNANVSGFPSYLKPEELTQLNSYFSFTGSQITFTPGAGLGLSNTESVLDKLNPGDTGTVTFTYVVQDALGAQSTATATFSITGAAEVFTGTAGNDVMEGSKYANEMHGLGGDDTFTAREFADSFFGDGGVDTVLYKKVTTGVIIDLTDGAPEAGGALGDQLYSIERIFGSDTAGDWMKGGTESNIFYGGGGNDTLNGGGGDDLIYGGDNDDVLIGGSGNDNLQGDAGNDKLYGGEGDDLLYGGAGADQFIFDTLVIGRDQIRDFEDGIDKLVFDTSVYGTNADNFNDFTVNVIDATHTNVDFNSSSGHQTIRFTHAAGGLTIDASDFLFI